MNLDESERRARVREFVMLSVPPPARLIDLGAAPGDQSVALAAVGYEVTAVDLGAAEWGDLPRGSLEKRLADAGIVLVRHDLDKPPYPLPDAAFDVAVLSEVLEHLREYPLRSLEEVTRILRPGGTLVLTTPNAAYIRNRMRLAVGRSVYTPLADWLYGMPHARHAREYTLGELDELVRRSGLEPVLELSRHFYKHTGTRASRLAKASIDHLARVAPTLGPSIILVARRPI